MALLKEPSAARFICRTCEHHANFEGHLLSLIISGHYAVARNPCFIFFFFFLSDHSETAF